MTDEQAPNFVARVRDIATLLPGVDEQTPGDHMVFSVEGQAFAKVDAAGALHVRTADHTDAWTSIDVRAGADWTLVEDAIARAWELSAPTGLLEAGGR